MHTTSALDIAGLAPKRVAAPDDADGVAQALAEAHGAGEAVVVLGGGTYREVGDPPRRYDVALRTGRLTGIVEYNPADLTIVVHAGTTLAELDAAMAPHDQFLPLDPPLPADATIGGSLAANVSGPWRFAYGSGRDMVIGMRMALPSGEIARSGGRVVKNVAGYDLAKLFIGSYGTLGVIVEVALKIFPRPHVVRTLRLPAPSLADAIAAARRLRDLGPGLLSSTAISASLAGKLGIDGVAVVLEVGGTERAAAELVDAARSAGAQPIDDEEAAPLHAALRDFPARASLKVSTLPSHTAEAILSDEHEVLAHPLLGLTYLRASDLAADAVTALRARLAPTGGSVVLQDVPLTLRETAGTWGTPGPELALMRKVKDVFDPDRVMSPDRFYGDL